MANRIRTGDTVMVIAGSCKGQVGEVLQILGTRALVKNVNLQVKHIKGSREESGRKESREGSIHLSNLSHIDENGKPSRAKFVLGVDNGKTIKTLVLKSTGKEVRRV